ncbi:hypothetical protein ASPSYDRAFT_54670 [Aspergillus sydowii CBS 593.65]|uniref:Enoyl reductase (ER) domain-containing protein n=1 Tax=Aspergillus sydowii CBS 593.65 TaxID=1036612 RepID=A0A1L9U116_9EURO|nr:uncharacterized protein ASPSYDRAFT_54670 [Aspergillus sydowii CBS 593.65]OJJ65396.1 hypothetical protein ASPSYDRAFT_54670 [Aspergillus sydowii CBS 593.65]
MFHPNSNNALVIKTGGELSFEQRPSQIPKPRANEALVRVSHVAQNSIDIESFDNGDFGDGDVLGCDFMGTVEEIGDAVSKLGKGDIIAGVVLEGKIKGLGGYSKYTLADKELCFKLPPNIPPEEAVTVPLAVYTAYLGLFSPGCLNIDRKAGPETSILIWGSSSCVGRFAIQIVTIYRFRVIGTCSPSNFDLVRSLGASHVLDYCNMDMIPRIHKLAPELEYAFDTMGSSKTSSTVSEALTGVSRRLCTIRQSDAYQSNISSYASITEVCVWKAFLHDHWEGERRFSPSVSSHNSATELFSAVGSWLRDSIIRPNHP